MDAVNPPSGRKLATILIVDDHPLIRSGLKQLIGQESDLSVCGEAEGVQEAITRFNELCPDLLLVDLSLRDGEGWEVIRHLRRHWAGVKIIVVSSWDRINAKSVIQAGAMGFVSKYDASERIIEAIRCVLRGALFYQDDAPAA